MNSGRIREAAILGVFLCAGLILFGYLLANAAIRVKGMDRIVTVKGLAEREVEADIAIWPIKFNEVSNDLPQLYSVVQNQTDKVVKFLTKNGFTEDEMTLSQPSIVDRQTQDYADSSKIQYRFSSSAAITVYSGKVALVRETMKKMAELGKEGIALSGQDYQNRTEYLYTELNKIKPEMIEEATRNAREVASKFAMDSNSRLGKIRNASQGQFSIEDRDSSTQHIKKIRVVSTIEYYLSD
ncbi:MAG: SIMPL domain-containing protein [Candidatus Aureabacteria bacterium]|nr:SIMPL domain-containing protein [Candidatus Auribacterota bacterium]